MKFVDNENLAGDDDIVLRGTNVMYVFDPFRKLCMLLQCKLFKPYEHLIPLLRQKELKGKKEFQKAY